MEKKTLGVKQLITVGIFTALYLVMFFICGMIGYIPIAYALLPFIVPVLCGIPYMLFLTRVDRFGMTTILSVLCGLFMMLTGHTYVPLITAIVAGVAGDLIYMAGKYKSRKMFVIGYAVSSLWVLGAMLPFVIMRDRFYQMMIDSMSVEYTQTVFALFDKLAWTFPIMSLAGGIVGAFIGFAVLKKHFKKAGIA